MQSLPTLARGQISRPADGRAGQLLLGRYRVLDRLGAGGFGVVWRARDEREGREVAVKRIPLGPGADPSRAAREALAAGRLSHPAIVQLYEARFDEDGFYLVSELVRGPTLAQLFDQARSDDAQLLGIIECVAQALVHAHARGVIHRDVKPQNILVPAIVEHPSARAKLTDFGGAQLTGEDALTRTGDVVGTLAYMAPEQAAGRGTGPRADLYSLALVLYEGLTGANPVRGAGPADTARRLGRPLPGLGRRRPDLPLELVRAVDVALDPRPTHRGGLAQLIEALAAARIVATPHAGRSARATRRLRAGHRPRWGGQALPWSLAPGRLGPPVQLPAPALDDPRRLGRWARWAGALAAGMLMASTLRLLLAAPSYAAAAGAVTVLAVVLAPRVGWLGAVSFIVIWLATAGAPGAGLIVVCAAVPVALALRRPGPAWSTPALAPLAGLIGLAGLFPALAAHAGRWPRRAAVGALGFWWLMLAQPLADRRLWLGPPAGTARRTVWEHTLSGALHHALGPVLVPATLAGALLWAVGAAVLPWVVRGRSAALDLVAAGAWGVLLAAAGAALERGLAPPGAAAWPRGLVLGTMGGVLLAVGSRALSASRRPQGDARALAQRRRAVEGDRPD